MHTPEEWNQREGCDTCEAYQLANEQLRKDVARMHRRISKLLENRGHVAAEDIMDKMAKEFLPNVDVLAPAGEKTPTKQENE
jgi:hypothetical protein